MIHTATVHLMGFSILAHGFSFDIPFSEICALAFENGLEAVVQKRQVLFENIKVRFTGYADIPFLCHAQIVSAQIELVIDAEIFCVIGIGFGATVPTRLVYDQIFILRRLLSDGTVEPAVDEILDVGVRNSDLRLTDELVHPFAVHLYHFAEGLLGHRIIFSLASIDPLVEDDYLTAGIYVGNDSDNVDVFVIVPLVKAGEYSSVVLLSHRRSFRFFLKLYHKNVTFSTLFVNTHRGGWRLFDRHRPCGCFGLFGFIC